MGVKVESAPGASGSRPAKRPREEAFVRPEEMPKPSRKESVRNLAEVHKPLAEDYKPGTTPDLTEIDERVKKGRQQRLTMQRFPNTFGMRRGSFVGGQICDICLSFNRHEFVLFFQKFSLKFECLPVWAILLVKN
jgi:hypothetical protein